MDTKTILRAIIGKERLSNIKGSFLHYGCSIRLAVYHKSKLEYSEGSLQIYKILTEERYHVFRGYYDLDYLNEDGNRFLCHRLPINAKNNKTTKCEIGYYFLDTRKFEKIADTSAWCWQQGSRLRWIDQNHLIFNDVQDDHYCARIYNVKTKEQTSLIDWPIYDITSDFKQGLTLNFSRLQRLRPGYGYDFFPDKTLDINAPKDDGVIIVDLKTGESRLLYSLSQLAQKINNGEEYEHYVNHISIAPDGKHFIFFHIFKKPENKNWHTVLYVSDMQGAHLKALEKQDRSSHYCWVDNTHIMITCHKENGQEYYAIYNIENGSKKIVQIEELCVDGHPNKLLEDGMFITDTYPLANSLQKIRSFNIEDKNAETIASIYHDYRLRGEKRCDLHPSISRKFKLLSVDSTFQNKRRSIIVFNLLLGDNNA